MAGRGVKISENIITPSGLNAFHGCIDNSTAILAVSDLSLNGIRSENFLKSAI
jgi:hypothetical protein